MTRSYIILFPVNLFHSTCTGRIDLKFGIQVIRYLYNPCTEEKST